MLIIDVTKGLWSSNIGNIVDVSRTKMSEILMKDYYEDIFPYCSKKKKERYISIL